MRIQFLGAAKNVTGSCYYIDTGKYKFLVDCGQFQGSYSEQKKNLDPFPFNPSEIDFIILTHAHIDHTGRLPVITRDGFSGRVFMTRGTASLSEILLKDSAKIHEEECERDNEKRKKAGLDRAKPYYTVDDAVYALQFFNPVALDIDIKVNDDISVKFINAGHLLGSAHVYVTINNEVLLFSGDIGTKHSQILIPPTLPTKADYVFMETTYGNRIHKDIDDRFKMLYNIIKETIKQKGTAIIPAFSVGRTQDIIYGLKSLLKDSAEHESFLSIPFYVDSPMAINATKVFQKDTEGMRDFLVKKIERNENPFEFKNLKFIDEAKDSIMLNRSVEPKVLISASGMCDAGRILQHLKTYLCKDNTSVIFVGYQSEESLGRKIMNMDPKVLILDEEVENKASIHVLSGFSGHADQEELLEWIGNLEKAPKKIFLMHGEVDSIEEFDQILGDRYGFETYIPSLFETVELK